MIQLKKTQLNKLKLVHKHEPSIALKKRWMTNNSETMSKSVPCCDVSVCHMELYTIK